MSVLNLLNLPTEVLIVILNNLSMKDMLNCSLVCKKLHEVIQTPTLYRHHSIFIPTCRIDELVSFIEWFEPISSAKKISYFSNTNCDSKYHSIQRKFAQIIGDCKFLDILELNDRRELSNKLTYKLPKTLRRLEAEFENEAVDFTGTEGLKELKIDVRSWPITFLPPFIERCTNLVSLEVFKRKFSLTEIMTIANLENLESLSLRTKSEQDISVTLIEALKKCRFSRLTKLALKSFTLENGDVFDEMAVQMPRISSFTCNIHDFYKDTMRPLDLDKFAQYLESQPNITEVILTQNYVIRYNSIKEFFNQLTEISKINTKLCFEIDLDYYHENGTVYRITMAKGKSTEISVSKKHIYLQPFYNH